MSEWKESFLGEIAEIEMGQSPSGETCNIIGNGLALLNGPTEFGIKNPHAIQYTTDSKRKCIPQDILFCVRGSTTGKMNWADRVYSIGRGLAAIRHKNGIEYRYFLKGLLDYNLELLLSSATGSTFPNVTRSQIQSIKIKLPSLYVQKSIASILSSLDNKIDLLHRQNATLEKMAETLFRQWFVVEVKEEWETVKIGDFVKTNNISLTKDFHYDIIQYLDTGSLTEGVIECLQVLNINQAPSRAKRLVKHNDVLISTVRPNQKHYGIIKNPDENLVVSTGFCVISCDKIDPHFIYTLLTSDEMTEYLHSIAEGSTSTYPSLKPSDIEAIEFQKPPNRLLKHFADYCENAWNKIDNNHRQIRTLTTLRDTLLPKLMSGEVRVE